jgi:hypothetical protein
MSDEGIMGIAKVIPIIHEDNIIWSVYIAQFIITAMKSKSKTRRAQQPQTCKTE